MVIVKSRGGAVGGEDMQSLVKALELKGYTQDKEQFRSALDNIAKAINTFGESIKPYQYLEFIKHARQAGAGLSERFFLRTAPTVIQEMGGESAVTSAATLSRALVGGRLGHGALKNFLELGLVDRRDVNFLTTGDAKDLKPGAHIRGWQLAQSDPDLWAKQFLVPALERAGMVAGATAVLRHARKGNPGKKWAMRLLERKRSKIVAVALANKAARITWALLLRNKVYVAPVV